MIISVIFGSVLVVVALGVPQRCDQGSKVCQKLEKDDPVFQGQRCKVPSDCKDEYNPYCSKWGYCISYDLFGDEGPGQSQGAVEDGTRGQCRDDNDCTPWAPSCSPLGYCRGSPEEWDWDGSFGSPTNPKPGGQPSDWITKNAKSGGDRNEEYYGKVEDDNRQAHVKFRKENPIFYEQIPVLLPRLEKIEKNVYEPCTYCNYDPKSDGDYQKLVARLGSGNDQSQGSSGQGRRPRNQNKQRPQSNRNNRRPQNKQRPQSNRNNRRPQNGRRPAQQSNGSSRRRPQTSNGGQGCPGGSMGKCRDVCPPSPSRIFDACVAGCAKRCNN